MDKETISDAAVEIIAPEGSDTTKQAQESEAPDYQALYESQKAENEKHVAQLENRAKSAEGQLRKKDDTQAELTRIRRTLQRQEEKIQAQALELNDPDSLQTSLQNIDQKYQAEDRIQQLNEEARSLYEDIRAEAEDLSMDLNTAPELEEVRLLWNKGYGANSELQSLEPLRQAYREARDLRRSNQRSKAESQPVEEDIEVEKGTNASSRPTPRATAIGAGKAPTLEELTKMDTRKMGIDALKAHGKAIDDAMARPNI